MGFPGAYDATNNGRQVTSKLWRHFNPMAMLAEPGNGFLYFDDFHREIGAYVDGTLTQGGSVGTALTTTQNDRCIGALTVATADTVAGDGPHIEWGGLTATPAAGTKLALEFRLEFNVIANLDFFLGFGTGADTSIVSTTTIAATDAIGFVINDDGAGMEFFSVNSGGTVDQVTDDVHTVVADTQVKLGFLIHGAGDDLEIYVNGEEVATTGLAMASIPDSIVYPKLEVRQGGTPAAAADGVIVDWMRVGFTGLL